MGDEFRQWAPCRLLPGFVGDGSGVVGDEFRRWAPRRLRSWVVGDGAGVVGDEFRRWASRRLLPGSGGINPAGPDGGATARLPSVAAQSSS